MHTENHTDMDEANSSADQMARMVFWIVMFTTIAFVAASWILVR